MANRFWPAISLLMISFSSLVSAADNSSWFQNTGFGNNLEIDGRIVVDADKFDGIYRQGNDKNDSANDKQHETELRRARLSFKFPVTENWSSKLQVALNEGDSSYKLKDTYLRYKGWNLADITIGQSKEPFGLENITSSLNSSLIERSLAASAFALGRSSGINIADSKRKYSWSLGVYKVKQNGQIKEDGGLAHTARATFSPLNQDNKLNHYGISLSKRDLEGAEYEIESNGTVNTAFNFLDTSNIEVESIEQAGLEAVWGRGALSVQAEYQYQKINAVDSLENASYQGYYLQSSYFLTDDYRPYKKGRFGSVKPSSSTGAIELVLRYSVLGSVNLGETNDDPSIRLSSSTFGVNYYLNKRIKLMLNLIDTDSTGVSKDGNQKDGSAISFRGQLRF